MHYRKLLLSVAISAAIVGCSTDDGDNGSDGITGVDGVSSLINQISLEQGDEQCFNGGVQVNSGLDNNANGVLDTDEIDQSSTICQAGTVNAEMNFNRVASFPVCSQLESNCDIDTSTSAEIIAVSGDKNTLVYTDSPADKLGFVDISNSKSPIPDGTLDLAGEPTSVAVKGNLALVGINTTPSGDYVNVAGQLDVVDITTQLVVASLDLGGQPDSVAISPDGNYAAVVLENERDEDLGDGAPPQLPAGEFVIVDTSSVDPTAWTISKVDITGLADLYAGDPEPEYVDINANNIAVVTMQENNHIVLVDLTDGSIVNHFSAGSVDLDNVDLSEEDPALISQTETDSAVLREPDGVSWINTEYFATANEGDLDGGSRGFSVFNTAGEVVWDSGNTLDLLTARLGHYPDGRSGNKGNEPENIEMGIYGDNRYLFVNSERSSLVFVYDVADPTKPVYKQTLPAGVAPEGGLAIPERNLLVVASEEDNRGDKIRSVVNVYRYEDREPMYPTLKSVDRDNGTPIPWSAMSGLSSDPMDDSLLYSVEDSFYQSNRIFTIDVDQQPARLIAELTIKDSNDIFAAVSTSGATSDPDSFDDVDLAAMINADKTVNIDPEGVAKASDGGFWVASEGAGTLTDTVKRPVEKLNFLFKTDSNAVIEKVVTLPPAVNDLQIRFGFEGVAEYNGMVYVAFQRAWEGESNPRIGIYDVTNDTWSFVYYPLDAAESQNGGWVGLSDISSMGNGEFLIIERDNQGGLDAAIKRLYKVDLSAAIANSVVSKTLVRDLMSDLKKTGGLVTEKVEGSAVMNNGDVFIINDNDGVDDNSGETQLINLGNIL